MSDTTAPSMLRSGSVLSGSVVSGTVPYAWPWDRDLNASRLALVITGTNSSWMTRTVDHPAIRAHLDDIARRVRAYGGLVVHLSHLHGHPPLPAAPGDPAMPLVRDDADLVVIARGIDGFYASDLDHVLREQGRDQLALCGFGLEATVHSTMRSANDRGYECLLLADACAALDPTIRDQSLSMITMSGGIFGALGTADALTEALAALTPAPLGATTPHATSEVRS